MILDGGPATVGVESTVVDLTSDPPAVLRPGGVPIEALRRIDPRIAYAPRHAAANEAVSSPGMLLKHYSPRAEVRLFSGPRDAVLARMRREISQLSSQGKTIGVLALSEDAASLNAAAHLLDLGSAEHLEDVGRNLFSGLRRLDDCAADVILVRVGFKRLRARSKPSAVVQMGMAAAPQRPSIRMDTSSLHSRA